ncbi:MAG TPA: hypothetical protein VN777_14345 [Terriglobales bacterium]|jgi:hypothetical protein|nr:hypothetical protein [Terriglobales bacterium]
MYRIDEAHVALIEIHDEGVHADAIAEETHSAEETIAERTIKSTARLKNAAKASRKRSKHRHSRPRKHIKLNQEIEITFQGRSWPVAAEPNNSSRRTR